MDAGRVSPSGGRLPGQAAEFFTYTGSTAVRAALLAAGFYVARGRPIGDRAETTLAFTPAAVAAAEGAFVLRHELLGAEWLERWQRSSARFPADVSVAEQAGFERAIATHPQFRDARREPLSTFVERNG